MTSEYKTLVTTPTPSLVSTMSTHPVRATITFTTSSGEIITLTRDKRADQQFIAASDTTRAPEMTLSGIDDDDDDETLVTLVAFDPDAGGGKGFVHWIVHNLDKYGQDTRETHEAVPYKPMSPPAGETHSYHWYWFSQHHDQAADGDNTIGKLINLKFASPEQFIRDSGGQLDALRAHLSFKSGQRPQPEWRE